MAEIKCRTCESPDCHGCNMYRLEQMLADGKLDVLMNENHAIQTAADVQPVKRGKWEEDCAGAAICSVCNEYAFETSTHHLCGWFPNFCPNCGADMREGS